MLATLTTNYFPAGTLNPGTARAFLIFVFLVYFISRKFILNSLNVSVLLFLLYLFILVILSSNRAGGMYTYLRVFISFMMLPVGYYYFNSIERYKQLHIAFAISLFLFVANMLIANIFKLGTSDYLEESIYFGAGRVNITKAMSVLILISPVSLLLFKKGIWRNIYIILVVTSIVIVLIGIKRSAIISLVVGLTVYFLFSPQKVKAIRLGILLSLFLFMASFYFLDTFYARLEARGEQVEILDEGFGEQEGRFSEVSMVVNDFEKRSFFNKMFGIEVFNELKYYGIKRVLHTDYMILLHGAGYLGLFWYLFILLSITYYSKLGSQGQSQMSLLKENHSINLALIVSSLFLSFAGSLFAIVLRTIMLMFIGASLRINREYRTSEIH